MVIPLDTTEGHLIPAGRTLLEKRAYAKEHLDWLRAR